MPVSLFNGIKSNYVQIVCMQDRYHERLEKMGWEINPENLPDEWPQLVNSSQEIDELEGIIHTQSKAIEKLQADLDRALISGQANAQESDAELETDDSLLEKISRSESKEEIEAIIKENYGVDIDKRGNLDTVKEKANQIIKDSKPAE